MDLRFSPEENQVPRGAAHLLPRESAGLDPHQGDGEPPPRQGGDGGRAQGAARQGPGRTALAQAVGRGGLDAGAALHLHRGAAVQRRAAPLPFNVSMCGPVVIAFGTEEQKKRFLPRMAALDDWWCQGFSEPGAGSDLAGAQDHGRARRATTTSSTARRPGPRWRSTPTGSSASCRTDPAAKKQLGISFILIDMKTPGITRAPDPDHGRRTRGQRGVLRRRQGAGREPGRPGASRLGLRQVPARQRAHRHRPRRLLQAARAAHQGAGRAASWPATSR